MKLILVPLLIILSLTTLNQQVLAVGDAVLFSENFDSVTPPNLPSNWQQVDISGNSGEWKTNTGTAHPSGYQSFSLPNLIYFNSWSATSGDSTRLYYSQNISLPSTSKTALSFWMFHDTGFSFNNDLLQVQISTDNGSSWINLGDPISRYASPLSWRLHTFDLSSYAGQNILLGFLGISAFGNDIHIDDVVIYKTLYKDNNSTILQPAPGKNDGTDDGSSNYGKDSTFTHSGQNYGSSPYLYVYNSPCNVGFRPAYLQFSTAELPNTNILKAEIMVYVKIYFNGNGWPWPPRTYTLALRRVTSSWDEMLVNVYNRPSNSSEIISYNTFTTTGSWGNPFIEFEGWMSFDITDLYKGWISGSIQNYGVVISLEESICANGNELNIFSSDHPDPNLRPKLVITEGVSYQPPANYLLSVIKIGDGSGRVISNPVGIDCGDKCYQIYEEGARVILIAEEEEGSFFGGWKEDCNGCGMEKVCQIEMTRGKICKAEFKKTACNYFTDVPCSHWAAEAINEIYKRGIATGYPDGTFGPDKTLTREEIAAFVIRAKYGEDFEYERIPYFRDVRVDNWAWKYIQKVRQEGIMRGCEEDDPNTWENERRFCPGDKVTREQMAAVLCRAKGIEVGETCRGNVFGDVNLMTTTEEYCKYIEKLKEEGITKGCVQDPPIYCPNKEVTRAEMAVFLWRAFFGGK